MLRKKIDDLNEDVKEIKKDVKELDKKLKKIEETLKKLPEETSDQVSFKVVGESYFRYDSTSSFYPTVFFRYKEDIEVPRARVSQIKMKLKKKRQDITDQDIKNLKNRCQLIKDERYKWGSIRGNYVFKDKRFKTTVFGKDQDSVKQILKAIMPLIDEPFEEANLTFTIGKRRESITKRTTFLSGIGPNTVDYQVDIVQKLFRVFLQVNGLKQPIRLFPLE